MRGQAKRRLYSSESKRECLRMNAHTPNWLSVFYLSNRSEILFREVILLQMKGHSIDNGRASIEPSPAAQHDQFEVAQGQNIDSVRAHSDPVDFGDATRIVNQSLKTPKSR